MREKKARERKNKKNQRRGRDRKSKRYGNRKYSIIKEREKEK